MTRKKQKARLAKRIRRLAPGLSLVAAHVVIREVKTHGTPQAAYREFSPWSLPDPLAGTVDRAFGVLTGEVPEGGFALDGEAPLPRFGRRVLTEEVALLVEDLTQFVALAPAPGEHRPAAP